MTTYNLDKANKFTRQYIFFKKMLTLIKKRIQNSEKLSIKKREKKSDYHKSCYIAIYPDYKHNFDLN